MVADTLSRPVGIPVVAAPSSCSEGSVSPFFSINPGNPCSEFSSTSAVYPYSAVFPYSAIIPFSQVPSAPDVKVSEVSGPSVPSPFPVSSDVSLTFAHVIDYLNLA